VSALTVESPRPGERIYDQAIMVSGKVAGEPGESVSVWSGEQMLGETRLIAADGRFHILARFVPPLENETLLSLSLRSGADAFDVPVIVLPANLNAQPYGEVVPPDRTAVLHRDNIYGSGPPVEHPSGEALALVRQFLPKNCSVLDLGCGAGAFGPPLISTGHNWLGVEVDERCAEILQRRELPFRQLANRSAALPFADGEFDAAIAIEVLEHIAQFEFFIAEAARVTRSRFLVSVPNMEVIPYFASLGVVPWHLLEATHVNFFTRASLRAALGDHFARVEVFSYGNHPVRTGDDVRLHLHLFAVADL
jgi:SAM-dependent methyltransferase